ncbi:HalOD1 output domain-containing protein [Haloplanus salilacus]|uniref:HalOD1 output domain-containing protein n=1 Tax=Haloplanus salilacus TaxID=2949994 RepID=UPI0030D41FFD
MAGRETRRDTNIMRENDTPSTSPSACSGLSIESVRTDDPDETYRIEVDPDTDHRLSTAIVEGVAAITHTDPLELDPLGESVDPECLDRLFASASDADREALSVSFSYVGCRVVVSDTTHITVTAPT